MHTFLRYANDSFERAVASISALAECESPTDDPVLVNRCVDRLCTLAEPVAKAERTKGGNFGDQLTLTFRNANATDGRLLLLGHSDTVWPARTLESMPCRIDGDKLYGPGVLDMKSGLVIALEAFHLLRDLQVAVRHELVLSVVPDEEVGSPVSRTATEAYARQSRAVFVLEPGSGAAGALKTSRKGVGRYRIAVTGVPAHAGVDWERGASAIVELARQISTVAEWSAPERGTTVNPGVLRGGTASNVVAAHAESEVDVRVTSSAEAATMDERFRKLRAVDARCRVEISGGLNRPPMERTEAIAAMFVRAEDCGRELGIAVTESSTGGGSDGNFTAALGVPTLDGMGGVGEGAHAHHEHVVISRLPERVALLAMLLSQEY